MDIRRLDYTPIDGAVLLTMDDEQEDASFSNVSDEKPLLPSNKQTKSTAHELQVYKTRWLMLFLFSLTTLLNGSMFMGLSSVVEIVAPYYEVSAVHVEWLSNMFMVVFIFVSLPSAYIMNRFGVRTILSIAAGCDAAAASLQYAGSKKDSFQFVMVGQFFAGIAYANMLSCPGKLSADWFPPHERGIATSIGVFMNIMGVAMGFMQPSNMIPVTDDADQVLIGLKRFFLSKLVFAIVTFLATAFLYREKPPTPPSVIEGKIEMDFLESLKVLFKDKHFVIMSQAYGIYFGLFVAISVVISQLVTWQYNADPYVQHMIGWMGFTCDIAAILSCLVIGIYLCRYPHHKGMAIFLNGGSLILWLVFIMVLTRTRSFSALFAVYAIYGIFGIPYFASGVEQAAEMTCPVPEGTSSTVILLLGNLYGFVLIFSLGALIEDGFPLTSVYIVLGLYLLSTAFVCIAKTELKRSNAESTVTYDCSSSSVGYRSERDTDDEKWVNVVKITEKKGKQ